MPFSDMIDRFGSLALSQVDAGAHYVWGSAGATPGGAEGTRRRPGDVFLEPARLAPGSPSVFAAACSVSGRHVCAGRYQNEVLGGGRPAAADDADLVAYLASLEDRDETEWEPYYELYTPRVTDSGLIVWGEDCRGRKHFDCVGLINWCAENAVDRRYPISYEISQWASNISGTKAVLLTEEIMHGDILIRSEPPDHPFCHIGMLAIDPLTGFQGVVEAASSELGVIKTEGYNPERWTLRRRPTAALFRD